MLRKNNAGGELGIRNPLSLTDFPVVDKEIPDSAEELTHREMIVKIKSVLSATPEILTDFYRVMDGAFVPPQRKLKLRQRIREILEDLQYGVEKED
jgi:hypothetical protein